jgi:hypothetical protein
MGKTIGLFAEDYGHEHVVRTILGRMAMEFEQQIDIHAVSVRGGFGAVESELGEYVEALRQFARPLPDLVVVVTDANCTGIFERRKRLHEITQAIADRVVFAIPNPHVERWLLLDPRAFKQVIGGSCTEPKAKCSRDRYKQLLVEQLQKAGQQPLLGGLEHARDIILAMEFPQGRKRHELDEFVENLRAFFRSWRSSGED